MFGKDPLFPLVTYIGCLRVQYSSWKNVYQIQTWFSIIYKLSLCTDLSVRFHFPRDQCGPPFPPSCLTKAQFFSCLQKQPTNVLMGIKESGSWKKTVWFSIGYWDDEQHFAINNYIYITSLTYTNVNCSCRQYELISISSTQFITPESQQHTTLQIVHTSSNKKQNEKRKKKTLAQPWFKNSTLHPKLVQWNIDCILHRFHCVGSTAKPTEQ